METSGLICINGAKLLRMRLR